MATPIHFALIFTIASIGGASAQAYLTPSPPDYTNNSLTADYTTPTPYSYLTSNDVRLLWFSSTSFRNGRLEMYYYNSTEQYSWMSFCISGFTKRAAELACKQLGYDHADRYTSVESELGHINITRASTSYISSVDCSPSDLKLQNCTIYSTNDGLCSDNDRVALTCSYEAYSCFRPNEIRLISKEFGNTSISYGYGRLDMYYLNNTGQYSWISFCEYGYNKRTAEIVCKQLGFFSANYGSVDSELGRNISTRASTSYVSSVHCSSSASKLQDCTLYLTNNGSCSDGERLALICYDNYHEHLAVIGYIVGTVMGSLVLMSCLCILLCVMIIAVVCRKKKISQLRIGNVAQKLPNNRMSDLVVDRDNDTLPAAPPRYAPSPTCSQEVQQTESHHSQKGDNDLTNGDTPNGKEPKDKLEDLYTCDDFKNLID